MKRIILLLFFVLTFVFGADAFTTKYHSTIAYIAEQHMTSRGKANYRKAFGNHPLVEFASYPDLFRAVYKIDGKSIDHSLYVDENLNPVSKTDETVSAYDALLWAVDQLSPYKSLDDSLSVVALALMNMMFD